MKKILITLSLITLSVIAYSQVPMKIDYIVDVYEQCDSIVLYEYGYVYQEEWDTMTVNHKVDSMANYKQVLHYKNDTLYLEINYDNKDDVWIPSSKVTYDINGNDVIEVTSSLPTKSYYRGFKETYNLDYKWVTKLSAIDLLPDGEEGYSLGDSIDFKTYDGERQKIIDGSFTISENEDGQKMKIFLDSKGKKIREEKTFEEEGKIKIISTNFLNRENTQKLVYNSKGDLIIKGLYYHYIYDKNDKWVWMKRETYLIKRTIY